MPSPHRHGAVIFAVEAERPAELKSTITLHTALSDFSELSVQEFLDKSGGSGDCAAANTSRRSAAS